MLTWETGMGRGNVESIRFDLPLPYVFDEFRVVLEKMGLRVHTIPMVTGVRDGTAQTAWFFEATPKYITEERPRRFLFFRWTEKIEKIDPASYPIDFYFLGRFGPGRQEEIEVGCVYDVSYDSMVTSCSFNSRPEKMVSFLEDLYQKLKEGRVFSPSDYV